MNTVKSFLSAHPKTHATLHAVVSLLVVLTPTLLGLLPNEVANMTLSGAVLFVVHLLENL